MKLVRLIALVAAFAFVAAACTEDDSDTTAEAPVTTVAADNEMTEQAEPADDGDDASSAATMADDATSSETSEEAMTPASDSGMAVSDLSLDGFTVGVAVVGTQHFWDREAFEGAKAEIERLGGEVVAVDGGRDNAVHAENHDTFLTQQVDAVVTILGDDAVEPKLEALKNAGIPVFGVDHASPHIVNNTGSDNFYAGSAAGRLMADAIGGQGNVVVFNAFSEALSFCGDRYETWKYVLDSAYGEVDIVEELAEEFANAPQDARQQTLDLLERYPVGELHAIHVACWDQPAIGVYEALQEAGRTEIVISAIDAGPDTLELMIEPDSPWLVNIAQQPRQIATIAVQNAARHLAGENLLPQSYVDVIPVSGPQQAAQTYEQLGY